MSLLVKFANLSWDDRLLCLSFWARIPLVEASLHLFGFKATRRAVELFADLARTTAKHEHAEVKRQQGLLDRIVRHSPYPGRCLSQSLTLWWSLRAKSVSTRICFGQRRPVFGGLECHAWLEFHGTPVNESPSEISTYTILPWDFGTQLNKKGK